MTVRQFLGACVVRQPCGDVVVVLPGIMGSTLAVDGTPVWGLSGKALLTGLASLGGSVGRLVLPKGEGLAEPRDGVTATGLMPGVHVIPGVWSPATGYAGLLRWLEQSFTLTRWDPEDPKTPANLVAFAYDWRLSCRVNAARLSAVVMPVLERWRATPGHRNARLVLVCHSMGGLVARYFLEVLEGREVTAKLITLGTPFRGSATALGKLVNGVGRRWGPFEAKLSALARSLPSLHELLPVYASVQQPGGVLAHHRELVGALDADMVAYAEGFHVEIAAAVAKRGPTPGYETRPVMGLGQSTPTTALVDGDGLELRSLIEGVDEGGDGTVPRLSARPPEMAGDDPALRGPWDKHGALPANASAREVIWEWLTATRRVHRAPDLAAARLRVDVPELLAAGEPCPVKVSAESDILAVSATLHPADGPSLRRPLRNLGEGRYEIVFDTLPPGPATIEVSAHGAAPVTSCLLVWDSAR